MAGHDDGHVADEREDVLIAQRRRDVTLHRLRHGGLDAPGKRLQVRPHKDNIYHVNFSSARTASQTPSSGATPVRRWPAPCGGQEWRRSATACTRAAAHR